MSRTMIDGRVHYQVKWLGNDEMTWEPLENLEGVSWMVEEFENNLNGKGGIDPSANEPPGFEGWEQQMEDEYMQAE